MGFGFDVLTSSGDCIAMLGGDLKHLLFLSFVGEMIQCDKHVIFQRYVVFSHHLTLPSNLVETQLHDS